MRNRCLICSIFAAASVVAQPTITTIAGTGVTATSPDGTVASAAALYYPQSVHVDSAGTIYFREAQSTIRKFTVGGLLATAVGTGVPGFAGDGGPATAAQIVSSGNMTSDSSGNLYLADQFNNRIRKVNASGVISTIAGNGQTFSSGDGGQAVDASFYAPIDVALDSNGNLYICENSGQRVRKVTPGGVISTIAGTGARGFSGDGGLATNATFNYPSSIAVDAGGNLYIADPSNQRVRRVTPNGIISTYAGTGQQGGSGDGGPAAAATLYFPAFVRIDNAGNLLITEVYGGRIRRVTPAGIISTVAGNNTYSFSGDFGPAILAGLNAPRSAATDSAGNIYIADSASFRIRKVAPIPPVLPSVLDSGALTISGMAPTLTVKFSHPSGANNIGVVNILINRDLNGDNACYLAWSQLRGLLYLVRDKGPSSGLSEGMTFGQGTGTIGTIGAATGAISNSQCTVFGGPSSVSVTGNVVTLTLSLSFASGFTGNKVIYLAARDLQEATNGWKTIGTALIPEPILSYPRAVSVVPNTGNGPAPILSFNFQDASSVANLQTVWGLINSELVGPRGCYFSYSVPQGRLYLYPSSATNSTTTSVLLPGNGMVENSQCRITADNSNVVKIGNQLTLNLQMTFSPYFYGPQGIWGAAQTLNGHTSPWAILGNWVVPQ